MVGTREEEEEEEEGRARPGSERSSTGTSSWHCFRLIASSFALGESCLGSPLGAVSLSPYR